MGAVAAMNLLETKGLHKEFGGLTAVNSVDFTLPKGQVHALIGPNGAGKSTFVGVISGRITPSAGQVWFQGQDITKMPAHARMRLGMAYTFQITNHLHQGSNQSQICCDWRLQRNKLEAVDLDLTIKFIDSLILFC